MNANYNEIQAVKLEFVWLTSSVNCRNLLDYKLNRKLFDIQLNSN